MKVVGIIGVVFQLNLASILGKAVEERSSYPDGPRGPDFAKSPGALKVDLLEGGIDKYWTVEVRPPRANNNEVQAYTKDAVKQDESTKAITLTAHKSGSYVSSGRMHTNYRWNSGDLESTKKHGYLEVKAKFPAKTDGYEFKGAWPAVWMLGSQGGWPQEGEIDIMESVNGDPKIYMSLHSTHHHGGSPQHPSGNPVRPNADFSKDGAVLGLEWNILDDSNKLDLTWWISYFDLGSQAWKTGHYTKSLQKGTGDDYEEFYNSFINHKGFYAIINLAEGGVWPGCEDHSCLLNSGDQYVIVESAKVYGDSEPDKNTSSAPPNPDEDCFEKNTDYHGSDLESGRYVSTESAGACQTSCQNTDGCEYWTWTPSYHNACWRKYGKGDVRSHYGITSGPKHC